jgi:ubiquinone/menaquinone biosynthesis C-methylase UbiE
MRLDPENQFIENILSLEVITDKTILEIGCGTGRITEELAKYAKLVVATDPNTNSISKAKTRIQSANVEYVVCAGQELPEFPYGFDLVVYSLSLHHIPPEYMMQSLKQASMKLKKGGKLMIIEPGKLGTFIDLEKDFVVGDGNEEAEKRKACLAIHNLEGWHIEQTKNFRTKFYFDSIHDFFQNVVAENWIGNRRKLNRTLLRHYIQNRIELYADRIIYLLGKGK